MRKNDSGSSSVGIGWEDMILPSVNDPGNCMDPKDLGQSEWDQKLGNIECVLSLHDKMRWKWDDLYLLRGLPNIHSPSLCPPALPLYLRTPAGVPWRCTWRPGSIVFGDALGGQSECGDALRDGDRVNPEMHLEAVIERVWRCTWRPGPSELSDALGGRDRVNSEMHSEAGIERVWRCTWRPKIKWTQWCICRPWSSEFGHALGGRDRAKLEEYLKVVNLEAVVREGGATGAETLFIGSLVIVGMYRIEYNMFCREMRMAGSGRQSIVGWCSTRCMQYSAYAVLGVWCTRCMLYSVNAVLGVNSWSWHGEIVRDDLTSCS